MLETLSEEERRSSLVRTSTATARLPREPDHHALLSFCTQRKFQAEVEHEVSDFNMTDLGFSFLSSVGIMNQSIESSMSHMDEWDQNDFDELHPH